MGSGLGDDEGDGEGFGLGDGEGDGEGSGLGDALTVARWEAMSGEGEPPADPPDPHPARSAATRSTAIPTTAGEVG